MLWIAYYLKLLKFFWVFELIRFVLEAIMGFSKPSLGPVAACLCLVLLLVASTASATSNFTDEDRKNIANALNLEYFEAEYFLWAAYGYGLDKLAPNLTGNGPEPIGVQKANLDPYYTDVFKQMGLQEIGHIRYDWNTFDDSSNDCDALTHTALCNPPLYTYLMILFLRIQHWCGVNCDYCSACAIVPALSLLENWV